MLYNEHKKVLKSGDPVNTPIANIIGGKMLRTSKELDFESIKLGSHRLVNIFVPLCCYKAQEQEMGSPGRKL